MSGAMLGVFIWVRTELVAREGRGVVSLGAVAAPAVLPMPVVLHRIFLFYPAPMPVSSRRPVLPPPAARRRPVPVALRHIMFRYETPCAHWLPCAAFFLGVKRFFARAADNCVNDAPPQVKCLSLVVIPVLTTTLEDPHTKNDEVMTEILVSKKK